MSTLRHLAPTFLWGASTAAHQVEGNNINADLWEAENSSESSLPERSGDACDSYHRWEEDLDIVRELGLNSYRFSIEWARIEPEPGRPSMAELSHYRSVIEGCFDRSITPILTLHHFTSPRWFRREGGWNSPAATERFAEYVRTVIPILDGVEWACTINEPNMVALMAANGGFGQQSAGSPTSPPDKAITAALTRAHEVGRDILRDVPGLKSGWTVANQNVQGFNADPKQVEAISYAVEDRYLDAARDDDFIGVQAYSRLRVGPDGIDLPGEQDRRTKIGWEFYPEGLEVAVRHTASRLPDVPILVTENGIATDSDDERIEFTEQALAGLQRTIAEGIDVRGYLHWSLLDNYEWGSWNPTFGLVAVDRTTFERTIKPSGHWYGRHVASLSSHDDVEVVR